jgi:hypothetical protein
MQLEGSRLPLPGSFSIIQLSYEVIRTLAYEFNAEELERKLP